MRISVIGCSYLGAVSAARMGKLGREVVHIDTDSRRIKEPSRTRPTSYNPGQEDLLREVPETETRRLTFTADLPAAGGSAVHNVRDAPTLSNAAQLQSQGAVVRPIDPKRFTDASGGFPMLQYELLSKNAVRQADALLLLTDWREHGELDPYEVWRSVASPRILVGGNVPDSADWRGAGWTYRGLGRP